MSTKKQTNTVQTNTYDKGSMNAFKGFTNQVQGYAGQWLGPNGTAAANATPGFNMNYQSNLNQANAINGRNIRNVTSNALALGGNPNSAATQAILARSARAGSGLQANAYQNAYSNAISQQNQVAGMVGNYRPLQTGGTQNTTEKTGGLGTWLPQLAGAAIGAGMGVATGGMSTAFGAAGSATSAGSGGYGMPQTGMAGIGYDPNRGFGSY